jgi:hypothetical protein
MVNNYDGPLGSRSMVNRGDVDKCLVPPPFKEREEAIGRSDTRMQGHNSRSIEKWF